MTPNRQNYWDKSTDLVNVYVMYKRYCKMKGKTPMIHYKFLENPILAKVCPRDHGLPSHRGLSVAAQRGDEQSLGGCGHSKKRNSWSTGKRTAVDLVSTASKRK